MHEDRSKEFPLGSRIRERTKAITSPLRDSRSPWQRDSLSSRNFKLACGVISVAYADSIAQSFRRTDPLVSWPPFALPPHSFPAFRSTSLPQVNGETFARDVASYNDQAHDFKGELREIARTSLSRFCSEFVDASNEWTECDKLP